MFRAHSIQIEARRSLPFFTFPLEGGVIYLSKQKHAIAAVQERRASLVKVIARHLEDSFDATEPGALTNADMLIDCLLEEIGRDRKEPVGNRP